MPSRHGVFVVVLFAMLAGGLGQAHADWAPDNCVFHHPGDKVADRHVADLLKRVESGGATRVCPPMGDGETWYYKMTPISKRNGVYYYYRTQVFPKKLSKLIEWTKWPPEHLRTRLGSRQSIAAFMCGEEFSCDKHYSTAFVPTSGVSIYLFRKLQDAWNRISKSKPSFDDAVKNPLVGIGLPQEIASASAYIFKKRPCEPNILSVNFRQGVSGKFHGIKQPHFEFWIGDARDKTWQISYEYDRDGIRILSIAEWQA